MGGRLLVLDIRFQKSDNFPIRYLKTDFTQIPNIESINLLKIFKS